MPKMLEVEIHYIVHIAEQDFEKMLKHAEELGYDFSDAGKILTMRRYFQSEGISEAEEILHDCNAVKVTTIL